MKQFLKIDEEGYYIEPVIVKPEKVNNEVIYNVPDNLIETPFTDGMHKPRWTGTEWIDEITQEELDERRLLAEQARQQEMLENPTEQMILGRQVMEIELHNLLLEQQVDLLSQQNALLANLVIDMELKLLEGEDNNG